MGDIGRCRPFPPLPPLLLVFLPIGRTSRIDKNLFLCVFTQYTTSIPMLLHVFARRLACRSFSRISGCSSSSSGSSMPPSQGGSFLIGFWIIPISAHRECLAIATKKWSVFNKIVVLERPVFEACQNAKNSRRTLFFFFVPSWGPPHDGQKMVRFK